VRYDTITLLLVDDHPLARAGIREILAEADDIQIVGEAQNGDEVKELLAQQPTKILLLDLKMPGTSPAELERWVRKHCPETVTLVLTAHDRDFYLAEMIDAGVAGYLSKGERAENLIAAIRRAAAGEALITEAQLERAKRWREEAGDKWGELTKREREILLLVAEGLRSQAIANKLCITLKTVAFHVSTILDKLGVESRYEAAAWLYKYFPNDLKELQGKNW
jgi:DNA-binding NarL/FixJ family response regulator